jgi:hypothetical protein
VVSAATARVLQRRAEIANIRILEFKYYPNVHFSPIFPMLRTVEPLFLYYGFLRFTAQK